MVKNVAIPKGKVRIMITIHEETLKLIDELQSLHCGAPRGNIIESALYVFAQIDAKKLEQRTEALEEKEIKEKC